MPIYHCVGTWNTTLGFDNYTKRASFFRFRRNDLAKSRDFCKALNFRLLFFQEKSDRRPVRCEKQRSIQAN
jgi:hypothetical protein